MSKVKLESLKYSDMHAHVFKAFVGIQVEELMFKMCQVQMQFTSRLSISNCGRTLLVMHLLYTCTHMVCNKTKACCLYK